MEKRKGYKFIKQFPDSEPIVAMLNFQDRIILATSKGLYELKEDVLEAIEMKMETLKE